MVAYFYSEIRDLYTHYQRRRVGEIDDARLKFELNTMLSREVIAISLFFVSFSCGLTGTKVVFAEDISKIKL